jgi:serine/threonine protein kinase
MSDASPPLKTPINPESPTLPPGEASELASQPLPGELFGRYRLDKKLGQGGMGVVYLAWDTLLERSVALKLPFLHGTNNETVRARFFREARCAAALQHPNICPLFDTGEFEGKPYFTMPFLDGEPLSRRIGQAIPLPEACTLVRKLALALQEAHDRGVIHRDLKPANVMIAASGEPILMDFGLGRRGEATLEQLTQQGEVMGTPAYMSPEQVNGDIHSMGPPSDVYSLGVLLYELLTSRSPFHGDMLLLITQILEEDPLPPSQYRPGLPPQLDTICLRALAKRPADRWPSMREFARALEPFCQPGLRQAAVSIFTPPADSTGLVLRIQGTPFAYRPRPDQSLITLGRQKRKLGSPDDTGNDVVLRIPGNETLSARISRRHLEIHLASEGYTVTDISKAGTLHNGRPLVSGIAQRLQSGDLLIVAGVITLEVILNGILNTTLAPAQVEVAVTGRRDIPLVFEASVGDMVTVE